MAERPVVLVTRLEYEKARAVFEAASDVRCLPAPAAELELAQAVRDCGAVAVVIGVEAYPGNPLYEALPPGGVIARFGVGHDGVDKTKATARGVLVTNTPGVLSLSVAEHAIWLMGALARHIALNHAAIREGVWQPVLGCELRGRTLAVIGCGSIGRRVASIACRGLGMLVVGVDTASFSTEELFRQGIDRLAHTWEDAVGNADVVSLHLTSTPETLRFVDAGRIAAMKDGALLVNTARGAIVDEVALYDALAAGKLAGAALDVFATEPYVPAAPGKDLRTLPNVLMTAHMGSSTTQACTRMAERCLANIRASLARRYNQMDLLNPSALQSHRS